MEKSDLIKYIELTWDNLKEDGISTMLKVEGSRSPLYLRANEQEVAFLLTMSILRDVDIIPKRYNNVCIQIEKLSSDTKAVVVTLTNQRFLDPFTKIAADVISFTMPLESESENIPVFCTKVNKWKNIFSRGINEALTPEEQVGLYGELELLKELINEGIPTNEVIDAWKGADAEDKDFQFHNIGIEVKSSIKQDRMVKISNVRQLDPAGYDELYLYCFSFAKSNGGPLTLPAQVDEVRSLLIGSPFLDEFESKLLNTGYQDADKDYYKSSYTLSFEECYKVTDKFPKITTSNIMTAIIDASYIVDLNVCDEFEISYNDFMNQIKSI